MTWDNNQNFAHAVAYRVKAGAEKGLDSIEVQRRLSCHILIDLIEDNLLEDALADLQRVWNFQVATQTSYLLEEPFTITRIGRAKISRRIERPTFSLDGDQ